MIINLEINNHTPDFPIDKDVITTTASLFMKELNIVDYNLNILLTNDNEISKLNEKFRHKKGATNVLSFPFSEEDDFILPPIAIKSLGDIVISIETAAREADEYNQTLTYRLNWLIAHGLLHLVGFDHEKSETDAEIMLNKEKSLLQLL